MSRLTRITHDFVEYIPDQLEAGTLYISIRYSTAVHGCFCGCGSEVVTPISPVGWSMTFHGNSVSLDPSVGSWGLPCQSHYWIKENRVDWYPQWSKARIARGRTEDHALRIKHFSAVSDTRAEEGAAPSQEDEKKKSPGLFMRLKRLFTSR